MQRRLISSGSTFEREIGYSRAVVLGDHIWVSGTTGFDYATMTIADDVAAQTQQCLRNIEAALAQAGATLRDVVLKVRADEAHHRDVNHGFASTLAKLPPSPVPSAPYPPHATELRGAA